MTEAHKTPPPFGLASTDGLGPLPPCARVVEYNAAKGYSFGAYTAEQMLAYAAAAVAAERERCAKLCDAQFWIVTRARGGGAAVAAGECAAAIRGA